VEQAAETVGSLNAAPAAEALHCQVGDRRLEVDPAVRSLVVVVTDELPEHAVEMTFRCRYLAATNTSMPCLAVALAAPTKACGSLAQRVGRAN